MIWGRRLGRGWRRRRWHAHYPIMITIIIIVTAIVIIIMIIATIIANSRC